MTVRSFALALVGVTLRKVVRVGIWGEMGVMHSMTGQRLSAGFLQHRVFWILRAGKSLAIAATFALVFAVFVPVKAQTPTTESPFPEAEAPFGLGELTFPETAWEIGELMRGLPPVVAGDLANRTPPVSVGVDGVRAYYGGDMNPLFPCMIVAAIDIRYSFLVDPPFQSGVDVVVRMSSPWGPDEDGFGLTLQSNGQDGDLYWAKYIEYDRMLSINPDDPRRPPIPQPRYSYRWAVQGSPWTYITSAPTQDAVDALVQAFVASGSGNSIGTPTPHVDPQGETCKFQVEATSTPASG